MDVESVRNVRVEVQRGVTCSSSCGDGMGCTGFSRAWDADKVGPCCPGPTHQIPVSLSRGMDSAKVDWLTRMHMHIRTVVVVGSEREREWISVP